MHIWQSDPKKRSPAWVYKLEDATLCGVFVDDRYLTVGTDYLPTCPRCKEKADAKK